VTTAGSRSNATAEVALPAPHAGRPAETTLGQLAQPVPRVAPTTTMGALDDLFRSEPALRWVVMDAADMPVLVSRSWFELTITARLGLGRLVLRRRELGDLAPSGTLMFPAGCPLTEAAASLVPHRPSPEGQDGLVVGLADGRIGVVPMTTVFEQLAQEYAYQARHDPLTGLPNRAYLLDRLRAAGDAPQVLCYVDLDRFKDVNDHLGHAAGDEVLVEFARRLRGLARADDLVVRLSGDEFAVLSAAPVGGVSATALAERIVHAAVTPFAVSGRGTPGGGQHLVTLGASVGVAHSDSVSPEARLAGPDALLLHGDIAMYRAKSLGRGRVAEFGAELMADVESTASVRARHHMERRLRQAISDETLALHYQPIVVLPSGQITGVEALARWQDAELGQVVPDVFIALAEQTGLVVDLGRWVLRTACRDAARWSAGPSGAQPTVAVNVSPVQLAESRFIEDVTRALADSGLAADRLCLEITETAAIADLAATAARLEELRVLGVRLALDDFGAGHSSLTLLRSLPVHLVKIDRSFVERVTRNTADAVLVRLVVEAAHSLGQRVCAEGVETVEQAEQLVALGCDSAQGWLFGRPERACERLTARLRADRGTGAPARVDAPALPLGGSDELVLVTTPDRIITYASASSAAMLGWLPQEVVGTSTLEHVHPEDRARIPVPAHSPAEAEGATVWRVHHRDGSLRWLEVTTRLLTDDDGAVREVLSVCRDVTGTVAAQQALADSEAMFRHAFDYAPIGMALTGLDGSFLRVNKAFAALLDTTTEVLNALRVQDITHPDDLAADRVNVAALADGSELTQDVSKRYRTPEGRDVPVVVHARVVHDQGGSPSHVFAHILPA
jgi:diguanylate cyclase (GGDEF)-like protein/PAS domain S-box-containing protein